MPTIDSTLARYADAVATLAGTAAAQTLDELVDQLADASRAAENAGVNGAEDLVTAAQYLSEAGRADGVDREVLLRQADTYLRYVADMADEYRLAS